MLIRRSQSADDSDKVLHFSFLFSETAINTVPQFCHGVLARFLHQSFAQAGLAPLQDLVLRTVSLVLLIWIKGHRLRLVRHFLGSELPFCFITVLLLSFLGSIFRSNLSLGF